MRARSGDVLKATDQWFYAHGLPYFVQAEQREVDEALGRGRLTTLAGGAVLAAAVVGGGLGWLARDVSVGVLAAMVTVGAVLLAYAVVELRIWPIFIWALRRTFSSLRLVFPLATRALPLLLLFITFLFINAEVWEVASKMDGALLWVVVLLFSGLAVVFLVVQLPAEGPRHPGRSFGRRARRPAAQRGAAARAAARQPAAGAADRAGHAGDRAVVGGVRVLHRVRPAGHDR